MNAARSENSKKTKNKKWVRPAVMVITRGKDSAEIALQSCKLLGAYLDFNKGPQYMELGCQTIAHPGCGLGCAGSSVS